jgi:hypothetical protein
MSAAVMRLDDSMGWIITGELNFAVHFKGEGRSG